MDLKGLKIVWIGMLLSLIGSFVSGSGGGNSMQSLTSSAAASVETAGASVLSSVGGVLSLVAFILLIVGLSKLKKISVHFKRARNLLIAMFVIALVAAIALVVLVVVGSVMAGDLNSIVIMEFMIGIIVLVIVMLLFSILYYRNFLKGCQYVSTYCGESLLAEKFMKMWRRFVVSVILLAAGGVVLIIGLFYVIGSNIVAIEGIVSESGDIEDFASLAALLPGIVLMVIGGIMLFVFTILLLVRVGILAFGNRTEQPPQDGSDLHYV